METSLEVIRSTISGSIESAREQVEFWGKYILDTQEELSHVERIASSVDEMKPCPMCGGTMINLAKIFKRNPLIRFDYGGEYLKDLFKMTNIRIAPDGYECQECGIFQKEIDIELKYEWTPEATTNRFAAAVFSAYPFIKKIAVGYFTSYSSHMFLVEEQWYTFGELGKAGIAERLHLMNPPSPSRAKRIAERGYIYLIRASTGQYKIGRTKDISSRFNFFVVKLPFEINLIHYFEADDMRKAEAELHERYKAHRVNGEWFDLDSQAVEDIKAISEIRLS